MKKLLLVLACASLTVGAMASLKSDIVAMNKKLRVAMMKKDVDAFKKICKGRMTEDFKYVENGQEQSFDEMVNQMSASWKTTDKVTKVSSEIMSCKEKGNSGVAKMHHVMEGTMKGGDGKSHTFRFVGVSTDTFRKVKGVWMMASMSWGEQKMFMDGKPFDPSKMGG